MEGTELADEVASLYRLAGYRVTEDHTDIASAILTVTARLPGLRDTRVAVLCVGAEDVGMPVVEGRLRLLADIRERGEVEQAIIVTEEPDAVGPRGQRWEEQGLLTPFSDLRRELLGLDDHLRRITRVGAPGPITVDISGHGSTSGPGRMPGLDAIFSWLDTIGPAPLLVLGEAGAGKSDLCLDVVGALAADPMVGTGRVPMPVLIRGTEIGRASLVSAVMATTGVWDEARPAVERMIRSGQLLIVLDDLDLVPSSRRADLDTELAQLGRWTPVMATMRPDAVIRWPSTEIVSIAPLTATQRGELLGLWVGAESERDLVQERLADDSALQRLSTRPLFLKTLTRLLTEVDPPPGRTVLFARFDEAVHGAADPDRLRIFGELAAESRGGRMLTKRGMSLDGSLRRSPLVRVDKDGVYFVDEVLADFYAGLAVASALRRGSREILATRSLRPDVVAFAVDLLWEHEESIVPEVTEWAESPHKIVAENAERLLFGLRARSVGEVSGIRVTRVHVERIKCFEEATFAFDRSSERDVTLFLGDNGTGKSTLLQLIVLCALGPTLATKLVNRPDQLVQIGEDDGFFTTTFEISGLGGAEPQEVTISLGVERSSRRFTLRDLGPECSVNHEQLLEVRSDIEFVGLFVAGYGATRNFDLGDEARSSIDDDPLMDRTASLFDPAKALIDARQLSRLVVGDANAFRQLGGSELTNDARERVAAILRMLLPEDSATFTDRGELSAGAGAVPLAELSDGYRSTLAWVGHLMVHLLATASWSHRLDDIRGIVLIDELDMHLHPQWQRVVVDKLTSAFPRLQFIGTTHSPLLAAGASSPTGTIARLRQAQHSVTIDTDLPSVQGWRADQILASELFGYLIDRDPRTEALFAEAAALASQPDLHEDGRRRYEAIARELDALLPLSGQTEDERRQERQANADLDARVAAREQELFGDDG